uniref:C2H2-type domain-containing protein n=1 Tax=Timema monikensis TaxID=170555 RepID=A0A7R9E190_9NEOP|nr:unnamed protein product [Timema monikensis]
MVYSEFKMALTSSANPKDFPRIAKEMGFNFSLRKGRVDWFKIGAIDVDRLVQDRDLVTLQENLINVINYNLDHEYDVKILDPNFVKLFKLAQLSVDYLMYSQQHVFNCVELSEDQINKLSKIFHQQEIERTKKECKKKDLVLKHLKRKLKELEKIKAKEPHVLPHQYLQAGHGISSQFKCGFCGKAFLTDIYLEAHLVRRHNTLVQQNVSREPERPHTDLIFQGSVKLDLLRTILSAPENGFDVTESIVSQVLRPITTALRSWFLSAPSAFILRGFDVMKLKDSIEKSTPNSELLESIQKQETNLILFQDHFGEKVLEDVGNQLQSLDNVWKSRLASLESEHRNELQTLTARLSYNEAESEKAKLSYEAKILALISRVREQVVIMKAQGERIQMLNENKARVDEPKTVGDGDAGTPLSSGIHVDYIINTNLSEEQQEKKRESAPLSNSRDNLIDKVVVDSNERQGSAHSSRDSGLDSPKRTLLVPTLAEEKNVSESTNDSDSGSGSYEETSASPTNRIGKVELEESGKPFRKNHPQFTEPRSPRPQQSAQHDKRVSQLCHRGGLEDTIALNPRILAELKNNLQDILIRKLREIGIDPSWTGIPAATFKQKMVTLKHHRTLVAKRHKNFFKLRKNIINTLEGKLLEHNKNNKENLDKKHKLIEPYPTRRSMGLKKIVSSVRRTALRGLYQPEKKNFHKRRGSTDHGPNIGRTHRTSISYSESNIKDVQKPSQSHIADNKMVTSTPLKDSFVAAASSNRSNYFFVSTTIDESVEEIAKEPPSSSSNDNEESDLSEVEVKVAKQPTSYKGVLKTPQYAAGSLSKKRATFNNTETKYVDTSLVTKPSSTTSTPMTENMPVSQSQFSIESPRNTSNKTVTFSEDVKKQKPNTDMDSDSDWSISSDESAAKIKISTEDKTTALLDVGGDPIIHLSTKQSAKIAEISKSIEHQCQRKRNPRRFAVKDQEQCYPRRKDLLSRMECKEEGFVVKRNATILIVKDKQPEEEQFVVERNATILIVKDNATQEGRICCQGPRTLQPEEEGCDKC